MSGSMDVVAPKIVHRIRIGISIGDVDLLKKKLVLM